MTQPNPATKTRAEIAHSLSGFLYDVGNRDVRVRANLTRTGIAIADSTLITNGYGEDHHWLCEHFARVRLDDVAGLTSLARRLVERLTIEGESVADDSSRAIDSLIADTARHLANSGDREAILAHMRTLDVERLAHLATDALIKMSDRDRLIEENFRLRGRVDIKLAKGEQAWVEAVLG
ncbi:hypothetical protein [Nocardia sp. NPDC058480]|uniref:hypothetical protein n=1 Tax=Nocardia sp. NPDC058480 TaxID=3346522 RepID=UPI0036646294